MFAIVPCPHRYLYEVVVDPAFQRQGLASHLITMMETVVSSTLSSLLDLPHPAIFDIGVTLMFLHF